MTQEARITTEKRRGRPSTGQAMTDAQRQRAYRQRVKAKPPASAPASILIPERWVSLQMQLDVAQLELAQAKTLVQSLQRTVQELKQANAPIKAQVTKYRNENSALRDKNQHLEFVASTDAATIEVKHLQAENARLLRQYQAVVQQMNASSTNAIKK